MEWIELPVFFVDKTADQIHKDVEEGVEYSEDDYSISWCCFRKSEIVSFNQALDPKESTMRVKDDGDFRVALTYTELKNIILDS